MDQSSWRSNARLVFYLQMVYLSLSLSLVIAFGIVLCVGLIPNPNSETGISRELKGPHSAQDEPSSSSSPDSRLQDHIIMVKTVHAFDGSVNAYWIVGVPIPSYICWIAYFIFAVSTGAQMCVVDELSEATTTGTTTKKALNSARTWRNDIKVFLVLGRLILAVFLLAGFITSGPLQVLCFLLSLIFALDFSVKYGCLYVVNKFIKELEMQFREEMLLEFKTFLNVTKRVAMVCVGLYSLTRN